MYPLLDGTTKVQISLDLQTLEDALPTADIAVRAGVDWLEVGALVLDRQCQLDRHRRHRFDEQGACGCVDLGPRDALAGGVTKLLPTAEADVVGYELAATPDIVVDMHAAAA